MDVLHEDIKRKGEAEIRNSGDISSFSNPSQRDAVYLNHKFKIGYEKILK